MILFPAIDLRGGRVVRLQQGRFDAETVYAEEPLTVAQEFVAAGATALHVVDLDGALSGDLQNLNSIQLVTQKLPSLFVQMGGGLRTREAVERVLTAGVSRAVIGTKACESLPFLTELVNEFGADRIAVGIDAKNGVVSTRGWTVPSQWMAVDLAKAVVQHGIRTIIYTDIATDGMLTGPNFEALTTLQTAEPSAQYVASGGVANIKHIGDLIAVKPALSGAIVGKAIYEKTLDLREALALCAKVA